MAENEASLRQRLIGAGLVNLACLAWSTNVVMGRWLKDDIGPLTLTALRATIASIPLALILARQPAEQRRYKGAFRPILAMALTGFGSFSICMYWGLHHTTASNAALIQALSPLITALLAGVVIAEPANRRQVIGALIAFTGTAGLISGGSPAFFTRAEVNVGDLIMLVAATIWALFALAGRRAVQHRSSTAATALGMFLAAAMLWPFALWEQWNSPIVVTPKLVLAVLHIGLVPTLIGMWAWQQGIKILSASGAMVYYNTLPLYAVLLAALFLGERLLWPHYLFGSVILAGAVWGSLPPGKR